MKDEPIKSHTPPPHGYICELAKLCNCNRKTVARALFKGQKGRKSDEVREQYLHIYGQNTRVDIP